jgi:tetratricopeptide (TPR) repeat protein
LSTTTASPQIQRRYTRTDNRGSYPRLTGMPDLEHNRLAIFWRPIIDMTHSELAPLRLRVVRQISAWLAEPAPRPTSWFAIIGIPGLRSQVLRHAGLDQYECKNPAGLAPELRTPQWSRLVELIEQFSDIDDATRSLVVFQLAQLSFCSYAAELAGPVVPDGDPLHDRYVYETARIAARVTERTSWALETFDALAKTAESPRLALAACSQGIGHSIRSGAGIESAARFEEHGERITADGFDEEPYTHLALLRLAQRRPEEMRSEVELAVQFSDLLYASEPTGADRLVADENLRIILESQIKAASRARGAESAAQLRHFSNALYEMDPTCVEALLIVADGYATAGDLTEAAEWYARAGRLSTGAGAIGWFRAGQCLDLLGDRGGALHAMGRCLELDTTAVEPRAYLEAAVR